MPSRERDGHYEQMMSPSSQPLYQVLSSSFTVLLCLTLRAAVVDTSTQQEYFNSSSNSRQVLIGYITGSQRRAGNNIYSRHGQTISGALTYAVDVINTKHPLINDRKLSFVVAETFGEESESILKTAQLWSHNKVDVYIGPQETCVHEARMADSFNLPMISYVSFFIQKQI